MRGEDGLLRLTTSDAGALARFADLYTRMEGGNLDLVLADRRRKPTRVRRR